MVVRRLIDEAIAQHDVDVVDELAAGDLGRLTRGRGVCQGVMTTRPKALRLSMYS